MKRPQRIQVLQNRSKSRRRQTVVRPILEYLETRVVMSTVNVSTYHNDIASTGVNAAETALSPVNVKLGSFGKLYTTALDGNVYTQPLVQTGVSIASGVNTVAGAAGTHDIVLVGTENDSLYALDTVSGAILWKRSFLDPANPTGDINNTLNATAITTPTNNDVGTGDISPSIGITGTPVIDPSAKVAYLVDATKETIGGATHFVQRLHAINLADGTDNVAPSLIGDTTNGNTNNTSIYVYGTGDGNVTDPYNGTGKPVVQFNALRENERGALNLVNGSLYVDYASHGDQGPYHGWVTRYDVSNLAGAGFKLTGVLNTDPNGAEAGIWGGGGQLSFDSSGAFYFATGNGPSQHPALTLNAQGFPTDASYYEAVVKVVSDPTSTPTSGNANGWGLKVADFFIPSNQAALDGADQDLGSGAPLVLPDSAGIAGHPHLLVTGGKQGVIYLIDRDNMGKFGSTDAVVSEQNVVGGVLGTPAYFNGKIYYVGDYSSNTRSLTINANGSLTIATQSNPNINFGYLPGSVSISASGTTGGIVWNLDRNANALHAFDASALSTELWNSNQAANSVDAVGASIKFGTPTIANGEVFVGTAGNALVAYGLKPPPSQVPNAPSNLAATSPSSTSVNLTWTDNSTSPNVATGFVVQESTDGTHFTTVTTVPGGSTSIAVGGLATGTAYSFQIYAYDGAGNSGLSNVAKITTGSTTPQAPAAPSALGATPATATSVTLNWTNNATNQTGFALDRATDSGFTQNLITEVLPASPNSFTDSAQGLTPGNTYYYRLRATNASGASAGSNTAIVAIPVAPPKATNALVTSVTTGAIGLSWTDNAGRAATSYLILRKVGTGSFVNYATLPATNNTPPSTYTWTDTGVSPGTVYEYHIEAVNSSGNNDFVGANAETITLAPSGLSATPGPGQVTLAWTAPAGAFSYNVYRGTASGQETLDQSGLTATTFTDSSAVAGTKYYYTVTAVNGNTTHSPVLPSESAPSSEVAATAAAGNPPAINFPNGFASGTSGVLTFNGGAAVSGANLQLTDGGVSEARSVFSTSPVSINRFSTTFNFQLSAGATTADGFAFVIQGVGNTALGSLGGGLGYGTDGTNAGATIGNSLAVKFDLYNNQGEGGDSTGVYTNGASPTNIGSIDMTGTVDLHSGDAMTATISYDGSNLVETINDTVTHAAFSHTYAGENIPSLVGAGKAYVGFTAGTGGLTATQNITGWTFSPVATSVNLSGAFNSTGIYNDGATFSASGGIGGSGTALSGTLLGTSQTWNGNTYAIGAAGSSDLIQANGQSVALTQGNYSTLSFLAFANGGSVAPQSFVVTYTDGTTQTFTQGISDWHVPQGYAGESKAISLGYKNLANGTKANLSATNAPYNVYGYSFALNNAKTVKSVTLPNQAGVNILAIDLS